MKLKLSKPSVLTGDGGTWNITPNQQKFKPVYRMWKYRTAQYDDEDLIELGKGGLLLGEGGCGKTHLIKRFIEKHGGKCQAYSPTWKAARNGIGGSSLYSLFSDMKHKRKTLNGVDWIIIDEISMMSQNYYGLLLILKKQYPTIKFILSGDFHQLPPVKEQSRRYSHALFDLVEGIQWEFPKNWRCDEELLRDSRILRNGGELGIQGYAFDKRRINLVKTNRLRKIINQRLNDEESTGKSYTTIEPTGNRLTQPMKLFKGVPLMAIRTQEDDNIYNSERWDVVRVDFKDKEKKKVKQIILKHIQTGTTKEFSKTEITGLFVLAYAFTTYKSQGETINEPYTIWEWESMSKECRYVALSRGTRKEYINIVRREIDE